MAASHDGQSTAGRHRLYVRVIHDGTPPANQRADRIQNDLQVKNASPDVEATVISANAGQLASLRAKTRQDADVWLLLSDAPLASAPTELFLVPVSGDAYPNGPIGGFIFRLAARDIQSANRQQFPAFPYLLNNSIPFVLLNRIPWDGPALSLPTPRQNTRQPDSDQLDTLVARAREVAAEYDNLKLALADGDKLPDRVLDRLHDHYRNKFAEVAGCADSLIPAELEALLKGDDAIRRFVTSALCVERFARDFLDPKTFDFALPGSGLWRAFERALNLSVIAALRTKAGIIGSDPLLATGPSGKSTKPVLAVSDPKSVDKNGNPRGVELNSRQHGSRSQLRGISLGDSMWLLKRAWVTAPPSASKQYVAVQSTLSARLVHDPDGSSMCSYLVGNISGANPCKSQLIEVLGEVQKCRNLSSHITPLSKDEYKVVREILLDQGHLAKVLRLVPMLGVTRDV